MKSEPWVGLTGDDFYHKPPLADGNWASVKNRSNWENGEATNIPCSNPTPSVLNKPKSPSSPTDPPSSGGKTLAMGDATVAVMKPEENFSCSLPPSLSRGKSGLSPTLSPPTAQICPNCGSLVSEATDLSGSVGVVSHQQILPLIRNCRRCCKSCCHCTSSR